jgi:hypothetical protein
MLEMSTIAQTDHEVKSLQETPYWETLSFDDKLKYLSENKTKNISSSIPIVLIDNSGSTSSYIHHISTLNYEVNLIQKKLTDLGCKQCYVMFWNSYQTHEKDAINVCDLQKTMIHMRIVPTGGTDVSVAIKNIPDSWYQKHTHMYIVTDGEVNEDKFKFNTQVFSLAKRYVNINIITVETNKRNYMKDNVNAGANIFSVLQNNKLTKYVRLFECFNEFHKTEPFVNLCNPEVDKNQFSYKEYVFNDDKFNDFVNIICELVAENKSNTDYLDKVMYYLSFTIFSYTKTKSQRIKNEIVSLFTSLFEEVFTDTKKLTSIFESEIVSHTEGTCKTYQQYKENRKLLFERTLDDLRSNVMECFGSGNNVTSFIINTKDPGIKKILKSNTTNSYVRLSDSYYNNGGIHYGNHYLPMLPLIGSASTDENCGQALRQWIRAIYARVHKIQVNDERILYLFLTDMMSVLLSTVPDSIKKGWHYCSEVMLQAKRFNSGDLKQIVFLTMGNKPKPMLSGYFTMDEILTQCKSHFSKDINLTLDELWFGICLAYGDKKLIKAQLPHNYDKDTLIDKLKAYNPIYLYEKITVEKELEYQDYLTLEDITEVGGYKYPDYKYGKRLYKSSLLVSNNTYYDLLSKSTDGTTSCPITGTKIRLSTFTKILPKAQNITDVVYDDGDFDMNIFNKAYFQRVNLIDADKMNLMNLPLLPTSSLDFTNYPYEFYPPVPIISEKLFKEKEQYLSFYDYQTQLNLRYDWLREVDMTNIAIAGGFNKSLIFDEKVNDIDIYIYDNYNDNDEVKYFNILGRVVTDITNALSKKYNGNIAYLVAYKKEFNVYELIYFENVKNLVKDKFEVQDLIQMKFITKIQIIMKKHLEAKDIFNIYDIDACTVLYDTKDLYFTERSYLAYRYLITIPRIDQHYTDTFDMRLLKYYKSGFRIALPRLTIDQIKEKLDDDNNLVINKCKFHVQQIENHNVYVDKCELLTEKVEKEVNTNNAKLNQTGVSVYNSVIGDIGSLDDSRSIVKFMKYVQRQNRLVERVQRTLSEGEVVNEESLLIDIDNEMKSELKDKLKELKLRNKRYVKHEVLLSDGEENEDESDDDDESEPDEIEKLLSGETIATAPPAKPIVVNAPPSEEPIDANAMGYSIVEIEDVDNVDNVDNVTNEVFDAIPVVPIVATDVTVVEELKAPEDYIRVYYRVSTSYDKRQMNEFDNGVCELKFIWTYENYHKQKDWYNSNVETTNKVIEEKEKLLKAELEKQKQQLMTLPISITFPQVQQASPIPVLTKKNMLNKSRKFIQSDSSSDSEDSDNSNESPKPIRKKVATKVILASSYSSESENESSESENESSESEDDSNSSSESESSTSTPPKPVKVYRETKFTMPSNIPLIDVEQVSDFVLDTNVIVDNIVQQVFDSVFDADSEE